MKLDSLLDEKGYIEIIDVQVHYRLLLLPHCLTLHQSKNTFDENFPHSLHTCAKKKKKAKHQVTHTHKNQTTPHP